MICEEDQLWLLPDGPDRGGKVILTNRVISSLEGLRAVAEEESPPQTGSLLTFDRVVLVPQHGHNTGPFLQWSLGDGLTDTILSVLVVSHLTDHVHLSCCSQGNHLKHLIRSTSLRTLSGFKREISGATLGTKSYDDCEAYQRAYIRCGMPVSRKAVGSHRERRCCYLPRHFTVAYMT